MPQNKKKFLIHLLIIVVVVAVVSVIFQKSQAKTGSWQVVGTPEFSAGGAEYISMGMDLKGVPYVSFSDTPNSGKATVMKFDGSTWQSVGTPGFSANRVNDNSIVFDPSNNPYVIFRENTTDKIIVMKFDGSKWASVGVPGSSNSGSWNPYLVFDSSSTPYLVLKDDASNNKVTVKKFDGKSWVAVGKAGFSPNWGVFTSLAVDSKGTLYAGFSDASKNWKATVMKFNGSTWVNVGTPGFSTGQSDVNALVLDSNGTPYVAYRDQSNGGKITVKYFDGSNWQNVGNAGFTSGMGCCAYDDFGFALDSNNVPLVAFVDSSHSNKATVMEFDGSNWQNVGNAGFTNPISYISLAIDPNNVPYISIQDGTSYKPTVMKFENKTWKEAGNSGSSSYNSEIVSIAYDSTNAKYVAFMDSDQKDKATVIKYDGLNSWSRVGIPGFTPDRASWPSLAINKGDTPYIAFSDMAYPDAGNVGKASVMRYLGGPAGWVDIGKPGFSPEGAEYTKIAFDNFDNPYVVFVDNSSGTIQKHITVMKYVGGNWIPVGVPGFSPDEAWYPSIAFDMGNIPYVAFREQTSGKASVMRFDGRTWRNVGPREFSKSSVDYPQLKFDSKNNLYISFQDWAENGKTTVMKYDGRAAWTPVGSTGFTKDQSYGSSLFIYNDLPHVSFSYVAATSGGTLDGTSAMKFDGKDWVIIGNEIIEGPTYFTSMLVDKIGTPFVSFVDQSGSLKVMKFD